MSQFIEMFKEDNMIPLGQFCIIEKGTTITREQVSPGNIPVVAGGKEPSCYHNNSNRDAGAITVSASGAYAGYVNYWDMPIFASDCNTIKPKQNYDVDVTFLYSGLKAMQNEIYDLQKGGAQPHVYGKDLEKVLFPLPIHEKQLNFSAIAKHADKSEFDGFKSQFIEMFKDVTHIVTLDDVVVIKDDCRKPINDSIRSSMKDGELYPYYGATGVVDYINDYITDEQLLCIAEDCGNYSAGEDSSYIINGKAWVNNHAHIVKPKDTCSIEYLHQYLRIVNLMPYVSGTTRLKLTQKKMKEIQVVLPSKEKQLVFVNIAEQADKSESGLQSDIAA